MKAIICVTLLVLLLFSPALAEWPSDPTVNLPVCTDTMNQITPVICSDGAGGAIIAWVDSRPSNSESDVYAQRVSADGETLWTFDGVLVCAATDDQGELQIIEDGSGGAIIVWEDERSSDSYDRDIYAQRIDPDGNPLWLADGVPICTDTMDQIRARIGTDGSGGAVIAWQDQREGLGTGVIYAQRVDAGGNTLWNFNGVALCTAANGQVLPALVEDGLGGAIVAWKDDRDGNYDIYAQRIDADGNPLWPMAGAPVCTTGIFQYDPQVCSDSANGAIITWYDYPEASNYDIRAQRIDPNGSLLWTDEGVPVCTDPNTQAPSIICPDDSGGAIIVWRDRRSGTYQLYAQRVDETGMVQWDDDGVPVCVIGAEKTEPQMIADGASGAVITWYEDRSGNWDIYAQRIDAGGRMLWPEGGVSICIQEDYQYYPQLISDGEEGAILVWEDHRGIYEMPPLPPMTQPDIYAQKVNANGTLSVRPCVTVTYPTGGETLSDSVTIAWTATDPSPGDSALLVMDLDYSDDAGGSWYPIAAGESNDGSYPWDISGLSYGSDYLVRVIATDPTMYSDSDTSDAAFTIKQEPPQVTVTYPNGGETLSDAMTITWTATDPDPGDSALLVVDLDYSDDAGGSWFRILRPLNEGFESGIIPATWDVYDLDGDGYQWEAYDASGQSPPYPGAHSGSYVARVQYNASGNEDWLITPRLAGAAGDTLKFWAASYSPTYLEDFEVRISTATTDTGDFGAPVYSVAGHPNAWQEHKIPLDDYDGMEIYVAVCCISVDEYYLYLDDFAYSKAVGGINDGAYLWDISELPYGTDYLVRVTATDDMGKWAWDVSDGTFTILNPAPYIVSITDVPGDQGREVVILWERSYLDDPLYQQIARYSIWRRYPEGKGGVPPGQEWDGHLPKGLTEPTYRRMERKDSSGGTETEFWEYIGSQDAHYWEGYSYIAPTLEDSSSLKVPYFTFIVSAHDTLPYVYYDSWPDSGYSVDDVTPAGTQVTARTAGGSKGPVSAIWLAWNQVTQGVDGSDERGPVRYRVYCDTMPGFTAEPSNLLVTTAELGYSHSDGRIGDQATNLFYVITAIDGSDNESVESNRVGEFDHGLQATK
jgi:hypothetical protein